MIEAGANEVPDDTMLEAIKEAHKEIKKYVNLFLIFKKKSENQNLNINLLKWIMMYMNILRKTLK